MENTNATITPSQKYDLSGKPYYEVSDPATGTVSQVAGVAPFSELTSGIVENNNSNVISGTDTTRDQRTEELNKLYNDLQNKASAISSDFTSESDIDEINAAREAAKQQFQAIVDEAIYNRKMTLPTDVVRAGTRGGFENTQFAGAAATQATAGKTGESFVGIGGALDESRQDLDRAVALARAKQREAMAQASNAARTAIRTRRKDDYTVARDLYDVANEAKKYADQVEREKRDFDQGVKEFEANYKLSQEAGTREQEKLEMDKKAFAQENEDRIADSVASSLLSLDKEFNVIFPKAEELTKIAQDKGISVDVLAGMVREKADELRKTAIAERAAKLNEDQFEESKKQAAIQNQFERQRIALSAQSNAISAGHLSLARQERADKLAKEAEEKQGNQAEKLIIDEVNNMLAIKGNSPGSIITQQEIDNQSALFGERYGLDTEMVKKRITTEINKRMGVTTGDLNGSSEYTAEVPDTGPRMSGGSDAVSKRAAELYEVERSASNNFKDYSENLAVTEIRKKLAQEGYSAKDINSVKKKGLSGFLESVGIK